MFAQLITERKRALEAEQRLNEALRQNLKLEALGTLAGGIAHDFNNLIFGIKLLAAELAHGEKDPHRLASLQMIDDVTERSAMLTRSLLGFARRGKNRAVAVALDDVVGSMRELLTRTMTGIDIAFDLGATDRGTVVGDESQLEQVVMNLVVNARDALRDLGGGRVAVRTRSSNGRVILEVADDGPGIAPDIRDRVFEPYFTTKTTGSHKGTGLGLATVFGIAESHAGTVEIDTGLDGRGVTLRVSFPAAPSIAAPSSTASSRDVKPGSGTILVVDDDRMVRRAVATTLRSLGYLTFEAASGREAVEIFRQHHTLIRAVVLDVIMPGMGGAATLSAMREIEPDVSVLLMSGYTMNEDVQALLDAGARGFVMKPYSVEVLARSLADVLKPAA
jgi:CheY-like chemotaxis protein/anti-sigma regulatory factor (Ser/Thr protein kinase)